MKMVSSTVSIYECNQEVSSSDQPKMALNEQSPAVAPIVLAKRSCHMKSRDLFFVFIRILFKCFIEEDMDQTVRTQAKKIVQECSQRNRLGVQGYENLMKSIDAALRDLVGDSRAWQKASIYLEMYQIRATRTSAMRITPSSSASSLAV
jgi:hypothetical protein